MEGDAPALAAPTVEVELTDMANGGDAVGRHENRAIFVKGGIAGERVRAILTEQRRDYLRATLVDVLRPSPDRIPSAHPNLTETGGLQWQHIAYPAQLEWKTRIVRQLLQRLGHIARPPVQMTIGTPPIADYWRQRTVAQFAVDQHGAIGFRKTASHDVLDMPACPIVHPALDAIYQSVRRWLQSQWGAEVGRYIERFTVRIAMDPPPPRQPGATGEFPVIRMPGATGEFPAIRVPGATGEFPVIGAPRRAPTTRRKHPALLSIEARPGGALFAAGGPEAIGQALLDHIPALAGVVIVGLPGRGRVVVGQDHLMEQVLGKVFRISAGSFFQVNASQTPQLVQKALAFAQPHPAEDVLDGYSGVGLFSLFLADQARHVTAIESQPSAVADARASAAFNHISNITIVEGLLERVIPQIAASHQHCQIAVVDPPRAGCHPRALQEIKAMAPRALVYISCDPATLARDLHLFCNDTYRVSIVQPVDMFPNTAHIETVTLVERR
jgi:23S rRNA (uracil1939-C5)-methyltransferase